MTQATPLSFAEAIEPASRATWRTLLAFWLSVFAALMLTQFWVMPLTGPDGDADASSLIRNLYVPAYVVTFGLALTALPQTFRALVRSPLICALTGLVFLSALWSIDPETTERRGVAVLFTTLTGVVIAARYDWPRMLEVLATALAVVVICSFVLGLAFPRYGRMSDLFPGAWRGVWYEKNGLGDNMSLGCLVFCAAALLNPPKRWFWAVMAGLAAALVVLSQSKTSLVSMLIGLVAMGFVVLIRRGPVLAVLATFVGVTALIAAGCGLYFASDWFFALLGKDMTLTGRTKLWDAVLTQIHTRPWTGFGYAAVWTDKTIWGPLAWISKQAKFVAFHSHNSWLEVWLGLGMAGLVLWALLFAEVWARSVLAAYRSPAGYFALPFLVVFSVMTLTETLALVYNDFIWVTFVALAVKLAAPSRLADRSRAEVRLAAPLP